MGIDKRLIFIDNSSEAIMDNGRMKQEREASAVEDYVRGYQEVPESAEEVEAAHRN